jgi:oligogalacturonide transporter
MKVETHLNTSPQVTVKNMIAYGVGDLYGGGAFFIIGSLFLVFLTDIAGLRGSLAGVIILIGKVWDAVTDPTMGYISDNTRSKHGRRRLYFLIGILPILISFAILWISFPSAGANAEVVKFIYYLFVYLVFNTVFTMVMIPYNSLPAEMTSDYKERSKMIAIRMLFSQTGMLLGAVFARTIINRFASEATGYLAMGLVFGVLYALPWIFVYKGTFEKEHIIEKHNRTMKETMVKLMKEFASTYQNKSLRVHIGMYLCAFVAMDIFNALFIYYLRDYIGKVSLYQSVLGVLVITQMVTLIVVAKECAKKGNAITYRRHLAIWGIGFALFAVASSSTSTLFLLLIAIVVGIGLSGAVMVPYNMLAFVTDADEIMTRKRREGTYAGMMTFVRKIAQAIALFLVGVGIELIGYQPSELGNKIQQSAETVMGIRLMFLIAPAILLILGFVISYLFKINPENHIILMNEIDRLKQGGSKADVEVETQHVVEALTGKSYSNLWSEELE